MKTALRSVDWNYIGWRAWQCGVVLAVVVTVGCLIGMLGGAPTP